MALWALYGVTRPHDARVDETGDQREQPEDLTSQLTSSSPGLATTARAGPGVRGFTRGGGGVEEPVERHPPIRLVQDAIDRLAGEGELEISVKSLGHRRREDRADETQRWRRNGHPRHWRVVHWARRRGLQQDQSVLDQ